MKTALEILRKHTKDSQWYAPVCDERILRAMEEYAAQEVKKFHKPPVSGQVCDFCLDTYRVQTHEVCERCRKICGD